MRTGLIIALVIIIVAAGAAAAYFMTKRPHEAAAVAACRRNAEHAFTFSDPGAPDSAVASADGADCAHATVTLVARSSAGAEFLRYSATYLDMAFGAPRPEGAPQVTPQEMDEFLTRWAELSVSRASRLPDWPQGAARLSEAESGGLVTDTPLSRDDYRALRARDAPIACYASALEVSHCLAYDAPSHKAYLAAAFGPHGADLELDR